MALVIVGLGNPGKQYEKTRHNAGRMAVELLAKQEAAGAFAFNKKADALVAKGAVAGEKAELVLPETMMNLSGKAAAAFVKTPTKASGGSSSGASKEALRKAAKNLLVLQDDLDLPLGTIKMVMGRGSGGHKGVESIMRAVKTKDFARIRIGISAAGLKHPKGARPTARKAGGLGKKKQEAVIAHVIGAFKPAEEALLKKALKKAAEAARLFASDGVEAAMQFANTR